ncbi:MAG: hypothetical protein HRT71_10555 [Flavobacteriales bacterium]|nr:hypothetical protein [Flavobacteriales bacterium]
MTYENIKCTDVAIQELLRSVSGHSIATAYRDFVTDLLVTPSDVKKQLESLGYSSQISLFYRASISTIPLPSIAHLASQKVFVFIVSITGDAVSLDTTLKVTTPYRFKLTT